MHLLLHDHANYAFTRQLAVRMAHQGIAVTYAFNADYDGPNAKTEMPVDSGIRFLPIRGFGAEGARASLARRLKAEMAYSKKLIETVRELEVDTILSANSPSIVQYRLARLASERNVRFCTWLQDLYGIAAKKLLAKRIPLLGQIIGQYFVSLDKKSLRLSEQVVIITEGFREFTNASGIKSDRVHVIENWAPVSDIPILPKTNSWTASVGLGDALRFVYSGTLAMKHNPALLLELAKRLANHDGGDGLPPSEVLVISSTPGAYWLEEQATALRLKNLKRLDFQPSPAFPAILGSADVLVAILEETASSFSVPSKVLSYLCAGKPILAAISSDNLAARTILRANAGIVVDPGDVDAFVASGLNLAHSDELDRHRLGMNGREYAESAFDLNKIADRFSAVLNYHVT